MLDNKTETLIAVAEQKNFTRAAEALSLTQPAVSHQISQLEQSLGAKLFNRKKGELTLTQEGEIAVRYARILTSMDQKMHMEIADSKRNIKKLRIGLTHTSESTFATEVLARYGNEYPNVSITVFTDTIKNLYDMLGNFEIDLAITDGKSVESVAQFRHDRYGLSRLHHVEQQSARKALDDNAERVAPREAHPASSDFGNANAV